MNANGSEKHDQSEIMKNLEKVGSFQVSGALQTVLYLFAAVGLATIAYGLKTDAKRLWPVFLQNHFFFMSLAVGGAFFAAIQAATGAMWSAPVRRLSEAFTSYLPIALITFLVLYFGLHDLYIWTDLSHVQGDVVLEGKAGYLSPVFFMVRNAIAFLLLIFLTWKLVGNSISQDADGSYSWTRKNRVLAPLFLVVFGIGYTMMAFDNLMSLDPHWFSTMFGVYCFAGLFYSVLAATALLTIYLRRKGVLTGIVNDNHLHDLGKFMFAFTVFYAYIGFSQFMLIWYANLPEETGYFLHRVGPGWLKVSVFLLVGKFLTPFILLLPRAAKRSERMLWNVGWFMLLAQWIDILWLVQPEFYKEGPRVGFMEIGVTLGFVGVFGVFVARFLARHKVVAVRDPKLHESVLHHHQ